MTREHDPLLQTFIVQLGAAMNATGQQVDVVQERLRAVANAAGARSARVTAFPTAVMVALGRGETATLELTTPLASAPRLDQIADVDRLSHEAATGAVTSVEGLDRLDRIRDLPRRFGPVATILGYALLAVGICLVVQPGRDDVIAAAVFGIVVGLLRTVGRSQRSLQVLMPVLAAFAVSALSALAVRYDIGEPGIRSIVAALVVFLPGSALTTAVLELGSGEMVSGASRLVWGVTELAFLAFGIIAGIAAVGVPVSVVFAGSADTIGPWVAVLGVVVYAAGITVAHSAPKRSFPGLILVLYAAWGGQLLGNVLVGGYGSALVGAIVMTVTAFMVSRLPSAMPPHASFLPGFWLLVPGAMGLIGLAQYAGTGGSGGAGDLWATVGSILGVALGVLCGAQLWAWALVTGRVVTDVSDSVSARMQDSIASKAPWYRRRTEPSDQPPASDPDGR